MDRIPVSFLRVGVHASQQEVYSKVGNQDGKERYDGVCVEESGFCKA